MAGRIAPALVVVLLDLLLEKSAGIDGSMINLQWHAEPYHSLLQLRSASMIGMRAKPYSGSSRLRLRGGEEMKLSKKMEILWDRANTARMVTVLLDMSMFHGFCVRCRRKCMNTAME